MKTTLSQDKKSGQEEHKLMLFDIDLGGHHGSYIQHLIQYWYQEKLSGKLEIVVRPEFLQIHTDPVNLVRDLWPCNIELITITQAEAARLNSGQTSFDRFTRNIRRWRLFCKYAAQRKATHALNLYLDTCEIPLALGARSPCPFSGIYFRPTFHYGEFADHTPSWKDQLQQLKEKIILGRILQHPQLTTFFCLDPLAVKSLEQFPSQAKVIHLPDPVQLHQQSTIVQQQLRQQLGIQADRQICLLFGALNGRKGIYKVLEAISQLTDDICQNLCFLFVGAIHTEEQRQIQHKVTELCQRHPIQVIENYGFIPEAQVPHYFQLADIVLAPYQQHIGMSGILLLAAAAGKPILSSNYGLMGELVRHYHLGLTVDSTKPNEIAKGIMRCLTDPPQNWCDRGQMKFFAEQHSIERYTNTIFQQLGYCSENHCVFQI